MQPLKSSEIKGNWATLLIPIGKDDAIDYGSLAEEIDTLIGYRVNGIYSNGTAGEFHNQTEDEFDRISRLLADKCSRAGMPFQIGVSHMSPLISRERLKRAAGLAPGAVQVILPDWFPPTLQESITFLQGMAACSGGIGLVLYSPPHAKRQLSPADFASLVAAVPELVGVKVVGGDERWFTEMKDVCSAISVFVAGHALASGLLRGASGAYSNVACLHPGAAQAWYHQMLADSDGALEQERRIQAFIREHIMPYITERGYSNTAVDKLLACIGGWTPITSRIRWPYRSIPAADAEALRPVARRLLPEFFIRS